MHYSYLYFSVHRFGFGLAVFVGRIGFVLLARMVYFFTCFTIKIGASPYFSVHLFGIWFGLVFVAGVQMPCLLFSTNWYTILSLYVCVS